ncbi:hypothetical protein HAX54_009588 [Datura stramonium]|uniref:Uncharacterized protein n=1 Tax=Datura stramonium TaxID=4076 RepID=A0ABS8TGU5_DATST|nr:hypothetical protein [Datura stramonium]
MGRKHKDNKDKLILPKIVINMTIRGGEVNRITQLASKKAKVPLDSRKRGQETPDPESMSFYIKDLSGLEFPYSSALVISLNINDLLVKHVFIDPSSWAHTIHMHVLKKMKLVGK